MKKLSTGLAGLGVVAIAGTGLYASSQTAETPPSVVAEAAWSQYIDNGGKDEVRLIGRFILSDQGPKCNAYGFVGASGTGKITAQARQNNHPTSFPVQVCQAVLDKDWAKVSITEASGQALQVKGIDGLAMPLTLPGPAHISNQHADEIRMVTLGDSGCQEYYDPSNQQCDPKKSNLYDLVNGAIAKKPDLIVHVGDYRYFQQGNHKDKFDYWVHDLFRPAQKLLMSAPWVMVRGNHENCQNWSPYYSAEGYHYFFEATDSLKTHKCVSHSKDRYPNWTAFIPAKKDSKGDVVIPSQSIIVIDTASDNTGGPVALKDQFRNAIQESKGKDVWWATHKPIVSLEKYHSKVHKDDDVTRDSFYSALGSLGLTISDLCPKNSSGKPVCAPSLFLVGHEHFYQYVDFSDLDIPDTAIVGNGGVDKHTSTGITQSPCNFSGFPPPFAQEKALLEFSKDHGFTLWTRSQNSVKNEQVGWTRQPVFTNGSILPNPAKIGPCFDPSDL